MDKPFIELTNSLDIEDYSLMIRLSTWWEWRPWEPFKDKQFRQYQMYLGFLHIDFTKYIPEKRRKRKKK